MLTTPGSFSSGVLQPRTSLPDLLFGELPKCMPSHLKSVQQREKNKEADTWRGAGGYSLPVLQRSGIPEIRGFMGFPWLG